MLSTHRSNLSSKTTPTSAITKEMGPTELQSPLPLVTVLPLERKKSSDSPPFVTPHSDKKWEKEEYSTHESKRPLSSPKNSSSARLIAAFQFPHPHSEELKILHPSDKPLLPLPESLPLIEETKKIIPLPADGGPNFEKTKFLTSQHHLRNTLPGMYFTFERGLKRKNVYTVAKIYSSHKETIDHLRNIGVNVTEATPWRTVYGYDVTFGTACDKALRKFADNLTTNDIPIIVDDGGQIASRLISNYSEHPFLKKSILIEQTSSGATSQDGSQHPKILLYASHIKRVGEAPLVADSSYKLLEKEVKAICAGRRKLIEALNALKAHDPFFNGYFNTNPIPIPLIDFEDSTISICGLGNIGTAFMVRLIKAGVKSIKLYDIESGKLQDALKIAVEMKARQITQSVGSTDIDLVLDALSSSASKQTDSTFKQTEVEAVGSITQAIQNCNIMIGASGVSLVPEGSVKNGYLVSQPVIGGNIGSGQKDFFQLFLHAQKFVQEAKVKFNKLQKMLKEHKKFTEDQKTFYESVFRILVSTTEDESTKADKIQLLIKGEKILDNESEINFANPFFFKNGYRGDGQFMFIRHGTPFTFNNGPHAMPPEHAQLTRLLIEGSELQALEMANEKASYEKMDKKFPDESYQLSPLWQLYSAKMFLDTLSLEERNNYYSEATQKSMLNIFEIATHSPGTIFMPFEHKLHDWLTKCGWLKTHGLDKMVDDWINPKPLPKADVEVENEHRSSMGLR